MDMQVIAMIAAGIGIVATIVYIALGLVGIKTLQDIREHLRRMRNSN